MISIRSTIIILSILFVASCGKGKYESMSNAELKEKQQHCDSIPSKSAVFANGCEKVKKEIKRRRDLKRKK